MLTNIWFIAIPPFLELITVWVRLKYVCHQLKPTNKWSAILVQEKWFSDHRTDECTKTITEMHSLKYERHIKY